MDSYIHYYSKKTDNWLLINDINKDSTEILGQFQLGLIRMDPNRKVSDDLNRPDTLFFTQGEFFAKYNSN